MSGALHLARLHVRSAPGIDDGGFALDGLSPGVNVVFGPNGAGKTTTAAAIEAVLWADVAARTRASIDARFTLDGVAWGARVDGGELRVQCDGRPAAPPAAARADLRHRYRLHLHELLSAEHGDADFAAEIARESAGGWDVPAAAERLGFANASPRGSGEARSLATARGRLAEAQGAERALLRDVERLDGLEGRIANARLAQRRIALLDAALAHVRCGREHGEAAAALAAFDPRIASLAGDEMERIESIDGRVADARRRIDECDRGTREAEARRREALPRGALPDALLPDLRARLGELDALRPRVDAAERELAGAAARCEAARRLLGDPVDEERVANVDLASLGDLSQWAEEAGRLGAERVVLERELESLDGPEPPHAPDVLARGIAALEEWLAEPAPVGVDTSDTRTVAIAAALVALVAAALLGLLAGGSTAASVAATAAALAAVVMLAMALRRPSAPDARGDRRAMHAESFARLPLPRPAAWERDAVSALLLELRGLEARAHEAARRRDRRADTERRLRELEPRRAGVERRRRELCERLGLPGGTDASSLHWLVERVGQWQDARGALAERRAERAALAEQRDRMREAVATRLAPHAPVPDGADDAALRGLVEALAGRERLHQDASEALRHAARARDDAAAELSRLGDERRAILERLGVGEDSLALLAAWTDARAAYVAAREREAVAAAQLRAARATMEGMPGFDPSLAGAPEAALEADRAAAHAAAAELEPLLDEASRIRARADQARSAHEVADALAAVDSAAHLLGEACERDMAAAVGAALVRHVQDTTRDQQRPHVFHRARDIFRDVTHGRWRLDMGEGDAPAFRAYDVERGVGHALDELSSATRMQLLVAVRLAFVETREREHGGARLPLLLDETLGTCDDARARAMIETVGALARDGRQVFYFTAQWDEVAKWHEVMTALGVPVAVHHLHELRAAARLHVERPDWTPLPRAGLPAPDGLTHAEYGRLLRVPAVPRLAATIGGVHLWHLVDDLPLLHRLLSHGVATWGALEAVVEHGGAALVDRPADAWPRIRAGARALEAAHLAARVGCGRPVDRQALLDSGVVSDRFMDAVAELAERVDGDAAALVARLAAGEVRYFRAEVAERLREWLVTHGHLAEERPLDPEEIAHRALAAVAAEVDAGLLAPDRLHRLVLSVLPPDAGSVPPVTANGSRAEDAVAVGGALPIAHLGLGAGGGRVASARAPDHD